MAAQLHPQGFSRIREVLLIVPFSRATLWRRVKSGDFPQPLKVSGITAWRNCEVISWIEAQAGAVEVAK